METAISETFAWHFAIYLWEQKGRVAFVLVMASALSWLGFALLAPSYEVSALIQVNFQKPYSQPDAAGASSSSRQDEYLNTQAMIISSGAVVRSAIADVGVDNLYPDGTGPFTSVRNNVQSRGDRLLRGAFAALGLAPAYEFHTRGLFAPKALSAIEKARADRAYAKVIASLYVHAERKSDLIRISFRHQNPELAAQFVNDLVQTFINRHIELASHNNGADFMDSEKIKFNKEFVLASAALTTFSAANDLYSADAQQEIALARRKDLQLKMAETTGKVSQREAEVGELTRQLVLLKLNTLAPQLASLARESMSNAPSNHTQRMPSGNDDSGPLPKNDPPLLLVRVYQDVAESLVKMNAELIGLRELAKQQKIMLSGLDRELMGLASKRAEFEGLKSKVDLARRSAEAFAMKAVEQRTELGLSQQKLVSLQLVQEAVVPSSPAFPTTFVKFIVALLVAFAGVAGLAFAPHVAALRQRSNPRSTTRRPDVAGSDDDGPVVAPESAVPRIALGVNRAIN